MVRMASRSTVGVSRCSYRTHNEGEGRERWGEVSGCGSVWVGVDRCGSVWVGVGRVKIVLVSRVRAYARAYARTLARVGAWPTLDPWYESFLE